MSHKRICFILLAICTLFASVKADIAPDPGYERIRIPLLIETQDDLSDYRFFFNARAFIQEVEIKKGETTEVPGGGGAGASGELLAVPRKSLTQFPEKFSGEEIFKLRSQIEQNKISGIVGLLSHSFNRVVPENQVGNFSGARYLLKRSSEKGIEAVLVENIKITEHKNTSDSKLWMIAVGGLFSLAVIFLGIWLMRRKRTINQAV